MIGLPKQSSHLILLTDFPLSNTLSQKENLLLISQADRSCCMGRLDTATSLAWSIGSNFAIKPGETWMHLLPAQNIIEATTIMNSTSPVTASSRQANSDCVKYVIALKRDKLNLRLAVLVSQMNVLVSLVYLQIALEGLFHQMGLDLCRLMALTSKRDARVKC